MSKDKDVKSAGELFVKVNIDTDNVVTKCRAIAKHLNALASDLESIGNQSDKICQGIDLFSDLNDRDLKELVDYGEALFDLRERQKQGVGG